MSPQPAGGAVTARYVLRQALRRQRRPVLIGVTLLGLHQVAEALVPVAIGVIIDRAVVTGDPGRSRTRSPASPPCSPCSRSPTATAPARRSPPSNGRRTCSG
ncbi:hypothetical protein V2I01_32565 [Micromonospora sp. BRA006-A]|nr:hypothetical protein [Micromonospora sp. BRA006-A]